MHALLLNIAGVNPALLYALTLLFYKNMASPTLSLDTVGDLKECCTVSLTPANATFNEDLLVSSKTNTTVTRDPRSLIDQQDSSQKKITTRHCFICSEKKKSGVRRDTTVVSDSGLQMRGKATKRNSTEVIEGGQFGDTERKLHSTLFL